MTYTTRAEAPESGNNTNGLGFIDAGEAYVWLAHLDMPEVEVSSLAPLLSDDERLRAERFHFAVHRHRYIVGRAILRLLLAGCLQIATADVRFQYGPSGKPLLHPGWNPEDLRFNTTHANGLALYGVTRGQEIGIDLEYQATGLKCLEIAEAYFSLRERRRLLALPEGERLRTFYSYWTRKEAYLKGIGSGLGVALDAFSVPLENAEPVLIRGFAMTGAGGDDDGRRWVAGRWQVHEIAVPAGYRAALAVDGRITHVRQSEIECRDRVLVPARPPHQNRL